MNRGTEGPRPVRSQTADGGDERADNLPNGRAPTPENEINVAPSNGDIFSEFNNIDANNRRASQDDGMGAERMEAASPESWNRTEPGVHRDDLPNMQLKLELVNARNELTEAKAENAVLAEKLAAADFDTKAAAAAVADAKTTAINDHVKIANCEQENAKLKKAFAKLQKESADRKKYYENKNADLTKRESDLAKRESDLDTAARRASAECEELAAEKMNVETCRVAFVAAATAMDDALTAAAAANISKTTNGAQGYGQLLAPPAQPAQPPLVDGGGDEDDDEEESEEGEENGEEGEEDDGEKDEKGEEGKNELPELAARRKYGGKSPRQEPTAVINATELGSRKRSQPDRFANTVEVNNRYVNPNGADTESVPTTEDADSVSSEPSPKRTKRAKKIVNAPSVGTNIRTIRQSLELCRKGRGRKPSDLSRPFGEPEDGKGLTPFQNRRKLNDVDRMSLDNPTIRATVLHNWVNMQGDEFPALEGNLGKNWTAQRTAKVDGKSNPTGGYDMYFWGPSFMGKPKGPSNCSFNAVSRFIHACSD